MKLNASCTSSTGGFSLDDAARAYRSSVDRHAEAVCPHCHTSMASMVGRQQAGAILILSCHTCGRGLVLVRGVELAEVPDIAAPAEAESSGIAAER